MYIFIAGMEKCGTTALADWIVKNRLAKYMVPNEKEPYSYAFGRPLIDLTKANVPILDASVGYALNRAAIMNMPEHNVKIVICIRNQFERTWSSYKMKKIFVNGGQSAQILLDSYNQSKKTYQSDGLFRLNSITKLHFPRKSHQVIDKYFLIEADNLKNQNFEERINYEISFFLRRRTLPFLSILEPSFYTYPFKNLMEKYLPKDIIPVSLNKLNSVKLRKKFCATIFNSDNLLPKIEEKFTSRNITLSEAIPDFNLPRWDLLKYFFKSDYLEFMNLIENYSIVDDYIDTNDLKRNIF